MMYQPLWRNFGKHVAFDGLLTASIWLTWLMLAPPADAIGMAIVFGVLAVVDLTVCFGPTKLRETINGAMTTVR